MRSSCLSALRFVRLNLVRLRKLGSMAATTLLRDFVLEVKNVCQVAVDIGLPKYGAPVAASISWPVIRTRPPSPPNRAFEDIANAKLTPDSAYIHARPL